MNKILKFYNNKLSLWVVLFGIVAYLYPASFLIFKRFINVFFAITMFGIGLVITKDDYKNIISKPQKILLGNIFQFTIMPVMALITAKVFSLSEGLTLGLVLTGAAPGAMTSNVISYLSDGDVAYSVSLTAVATILAPILTPVITLLLVGAKINIPVLSMFWTIIYTVVIPLLLGFFIRKWKTDFVEKIKELPPAISVTAIWIITSYVIAANKSSLGAATFILFLAVIFLNMAGMLLGYFAGSLVKFSFKRKKTLAIEIGMQNAGLGVILALKHFKDVKVASMPGAVFAIWCIVSASLLVNFWKIIGQKVKK